MKFITLLLSLAFLSSCSLSDEEIDNKSQKAIKLVEKVCDGDNELSWDERAKLAAQANYLDKRWERLADAAFIQVGTQEVVDAVKGALADYPEPALEKFYEGKLQYAKFAAECSILELIDKDEK